MYSKIINVVLIIIILGLLQTIILLINFEDNNRKLQRILVSHN